MLQIKSELGWHQRHPSGIAEKMKMKILRRSCHSVFRCYCDWRSRTRYLVLSSSIALLASLNRSSSNLAHHMFNDAFINTWIAMTTPIEHDVTKWHNRPKGCGHVCLFMSSVILSPVCIFCSLFLAKVPSELFWCYLTKCKLDISKFQISVSNRAPNSPDFYG